ncbi:single-stranded DNA-binding protein [Actinotalea caeni]|uniref:single-stranded DNA-binding protein n=1 Tax=Actinotalea caeni TaxID=1348467 RepID=UPI0012E0D5BD|nr:single-stranded DNA-binding protein [Actinotalea caeni]
MVSETEVTVRGRLGHNPELQQAPGKKAWVRLRVATNRRVRTAEGWADGPTSWYDVKVWDDFATNVAMSLRKGDAVIVQGALQIEEYTHGSGVTLRTPVITAHALGPDLRHVVAHVLRVNRGAPESGNGDGADDAGAGTDPGSGVAPRVRPEVDLSGMQELDDETDPDGGGGPADGSDEGEPVAEEALTGV